MTLVFVEESSLNDSELAILGILSTKLNLGIDPSVQKTPDGVKLIIKELINQKWHARDLHEHGISLYRLSIICAKSIYGFGHYKPRNPFQTFGVTRAYFF